MLRNIEYSESAERDIAPDTLLAPVASLVEAALRKLELQDDQPVSAQHVHIERSYVYKRDNGRVEFIVEYVSDRSIMEKRFGVPPTSPWPAVLNVSMALYEGNRREGGYSTMLPPSVEMVIPENITYLWHTDPDSVRETAHELRQSTQVLVIDQE